MKSIASAFLVFLLMPLTVMAQQPHAGYCSRAETTADLIACMSDHLTVEQTKMDSLFKQIRNLDDDNFETLNNNQLDWLAYRDETCALEGQSYAGGSLQRVQELDCHGRMTVDRNTHLKNVINAQDESYIPEYSNPPRWVNVLVRDYPNSFWNFGQTMSLDTDCDGINEMMVRRLTDRNIMSLAIADSEKTGKPAITVLNFDDQKNCEILNDVTIENLPEPKPNGETLACLQKVKIKTKSCGDFHLQYDSSNQSYSVQPIQTN